ncbi:hypothetical protein mru_0973 [Methanobrevibacter ruminantium M1]|uniref:Uncharacterized protein n=1 Tax=Methanobrevibacter ruminantium (strain ATCC 35063 / DSM 1093 / JCM 13430 / OCM 146 / M1) TaxID=634498 RepID=D3E2R3_METRM|nr:hypothetical protein [Methanobrevibacter ruminantium]ADC46824.1 hypothetical protein mru_0973 [Methanobrevibacter ruminantium M1]
MLSEEELRRLIESLTIREIIEPALDNWTRYESTGKTVIDLKSGRVYGISLKSNELLELDHDNNHIELYKIESHEDLFDEEDLLSEDEYNRFQEFKDRKELEDEDFDDYDPELLSEFCMMESIDEKERIISILIEDYQEYHFNNYQDFEHSIILNYYDEDDYTY